MQAGGADRGRRWKDPNVVSSPPGIFALSLMWDGVEEEGILWYYFGHCNSICKIRGKGVYLLSFHGVNVCLNLQLLKYVAFLLTLLNIVRK